MNTSAIIMMIFGLGVLWGGFAICVLIAQRKETNSDFDINED